jgi:hypothetical protein
VVTTGWVVRARSIDLEDVDLEILMPGMKVQDEPFRVGDVISMDSTKPQITALHVQRLGSERICITTIPLAYSTFTKQAPHSLAMTPPETLNMDAYWPVTRDTGSALEAEQAALPVSTKEIIASQN